ncbi:MAG: hypothetical protein ABIT10_10630 [Alteraurantiacibacter sp.]
MDGPLPLAAALLAVVALIGLARVLGFVARPLLSGPGEAEELAQTLPGGFISCRTELVSDHSGALLRDASGRIAVVAPVGAHFLVRLYDGDWSVTQAPDGQILIAGADFSCRFRLDRGAQNWFDPTDRSRSAAA